MNDYITYWYSDGSCSKRTRPVHVWPCDSQVDVMWWRRKILKAFQCDKCQILFLIHKFGGLVTLSGDLVPNNSKIELCLDCMCDYIRMNEKWKSSPVLKLEPNEICNSYDDEETCEKRQSGVTQSRKSGLVAPCGSGKSRYHLIPR
jgi:hypothetical protein